MLDVNFALIIQSQFAEPMEETTKTLVCAPAEKTVRNTVKENALKKRVVLDALESYLLFAVKKESLMITCAT